MIASSSAKSKCLSSVGEIFKNLQGIWNFNRDLRSKLSTLPSGIVQGRASFTPVTEDPVKNAQEYLYSEDGKFRLEDGTELNVSRQYFYQYDQTKDSIDVYFATNDSKRDRFFHNLLFDESNQWTALGKHLCEADHYTANYIFPRKALKSFEIKYEVIGPHKDYIASTKFTKVDEYYKSNLD